MASPCRHCGKPHEAFVTMCPVTGGRLGSARHTLVDDDEALVGTVVAERYHVREILGQGSTGTVFGTMHMHFDRQAAMKVLRPRHTLLETVQRIFHNEARSAFAISHPSLCEVFDIGTLPDGAPFFVMERLEGDTLAARLGRERFSTAAAVDLMMQLLSAMEVVHAHDLLLRDLRPQNLFLVHRRGCRPLLKVLDIGLCHLVPLEKIQGEWDALRSVVSPNDSSGALSIPYYLSPERSRGDHGIEPASDIFIAASIFYEALTGQKAFGAATFHGILHLVAQAHPTPLGVLRPDVPEALSGLVMRALSGNPRARPASARAMQDELRSVFDVTRRGSASMRGETASLVDAAASPSIEMPPASATKRPTAMRAGDLYEDETSTDTDTDRKSIQALARAIEGTVDEASADHPIRTVRPAAPTAGETDIEIDVDMSHDSEDDEPTTSRGTDLAALLHAATPKSTPRNSVEDEEDETQTMQLTPAVRARIEQMTKTGATSRTEDPSGPPPTRRIPKLPPQR